MNRLRPRVPFCVWIRSRKEIFITDIYDPKVIAFCCHYCTYSATALAGSMRLECDPNIRGVKLMCTGKVDTTLLVRAFEDGADAMMVIADRLLDKAMYVPRESRFPLMEEIVFSGKIKLDPSKTDFPVTLHDPCNYIRLMGIVEPRRRILRCLAPQFREISPHGVNNYCCGGRKWICHYDSFSIFLLISSRPYRVG